MKSNSPNIFLTIMLVLNLAFSILFCLQFTFRSRELRSLNTEVNRINMIRGTLQALANDCLAYSEKNPAINPILEQVGLMPAKAAAVPAKPATK